VHVAEAFPRALRVYSSVPVVNAHSTAAGNAKQTTGSNIKQTAKSGEQKSLSTHHRNSAQHFCSNKLTTKLSKFATLRKNLAAYALIRLPMRILPNFHVVTGFMGGAWMSCVDLGLPKQHVPSAEPPFQKGLPHSSMQLFERGYSTNRWDICRIP
jgi:hypothetical protein